MKFLTRLIVSLVVLFVLIPIGFMVAAHNRESLTQDEALPESGRLVDTEMGRIFVQEVGPEDGTPVLFAHGTGAWSELWRPTMEAMAAEGYRAIAFDMPPFGYSDRDEFGDYSRLRQADRLLALTEALGVRPVLVAHSFGATAGVEAAMREPGEFQGLVIVSGAVGLGSHSTPRNVPAPLGSQFVREAVVATTATNPLLTRVLLGSLLNDWGAATPETTTILRRPMHLKGSTTAFAKWLPYLFVPPNNALSTRAGSYRDLRLPTVFVWGAEDRITPPSQGEELAELVPNARLEMLPDVGHIPQIEAPEAFQQVLAGAISSMENRN